MEVVHRLERFEQTIKNKFPTPVVKDLLDELEEGVCNLF